MTTPALPRSDLIAWIDLEMTGLDPMNDQILEIATLVTDSHLALIAEGPNLTIHATNERLDAMSPIVRRMHARNGLSERVRDSSTTLEEAEAETLAFLETHCAPGTCPLGGNTIWMDRMFLRHHMPRVEGLLHYRVIDVSTIKELGRRWNPPALHGAPAKPETHRALDDIRASIDELRHYREVWMTPATES